MLRRELRWRGAGVLLSLMLLVQAAGVAPAGYAQGNSRTFPETGKTVKGRFLEYWEQNGGLMQQGFPISGEMQERSDTDGKTYTVQYFERAAFERGHGSNEYYPAKKRAAMIRDAYRRRKKWLKKALALNPRLALRSRELR